MHKMRRARRVEQRPFGAQAPEGNLELTDEEAKSIGANRSVPRPHRDMNQ